jgi:hypothetical protein
MNGKRRTHWQALAHRKYPRMRFLGGDGEWLALFKCTQPWSYRLAPDQFEAFLAAGRSCGPACQGPANHKYWRLVEESPAKPAPTLEPTQDEQAWEEKLGVDE